MNVTASTLVDTVDLLHESVYLALQIDKIRLLLPQTQCIAMASADNLQPNRDDSQRSVGQIVRGQQVWLIYALTTNLELTQDPPGTRTHCVLLSSDRHQIGLLCDQAFPIERNELIVGPIPECMYTSELLYAGFALYQDQIAFISTTDVLHKQLHGLKQN